MENHVLQLSEDRRLACQRPSAILDSRHLPAHAGFIFCITRAVFITTYMIFSCTITTCNMNCVDICTIVTVTATCTSPPCLCKALTHLSRFGATQPSNRRITQTTGCQSSTLKSTRMMIRSHDRVVVLSSSSPPHHSGLHLDCDGLRSLSLNTLAEIQPDV